MYSEFRVITPALVIWIISGSSPDTTTTIKRKMMENKYSDTLTQITDDTVRKIMDPIKAATYGVWTPPVLTSIENHISLQVINALSQMTDLCLATVYQSLGLTSHHTTSDKV
jgi:hypothetical protein